MYFATHKEIEPLQKLLFMGYYHLCETGSVIEKVVHFSIHGGYIKFTIKDVFERAHLM